MENTSLSLEELEIIKNALLRVDTEMAISIALKIQTVIDYGLTH